MIKLLHKLPQVLCLLAPCLFALPMQGNTSIAERKSLHELAGPVAAVFQEKVISGKVTEGDTGDALPGSSVVVKGTSVGTTTDTNGKYTLSVPADAQTLTISYIGYAPMEITIGNQTVIDVALTPDLQTLSEVVVVGYGTQKKSDFTGAISSVKAEDLAQMPTQRIDQALQGRAAGVMVLNQSGQPGGGTTIRIRGLSSITGSNQPLIVIDGLQGGRLEALNPNDIESMEILKDASATAVYGSQGANGVILITTKKGKKGAPVVNYNYSLGFSQISKKLDLMGAGDFVKSINDFRQTQNMSGNTPITPTPIFSVEEAAYWQTHKGTDWQDEVYRTAPMQNHQLSISGGSDNIQYFVSGGLLDQKGILINSAYQRFSLRANVNVDLAKWAKFGMTWAGIKEKGNSPPFGEGTSDIDPTGQVVSVAPRWNPTIPVYDENGNYSTHPTNYGEPATWNPVASGKEPFVENNSLSNNLSAFLEFKLLKDLTFRVTGGAITRNQDNLRYLNRKTRAGFQQNGAGYIQANMYTRLQNSNILTYDKMLNELNHLTVTAVVEQQVEQTKASQTNASNFLSDASGISNIGAATVQASSSSSTKRVINSFLGRVNYVYNEKYLITASYRIDGSSVFGANNKYGYFPSASVAWRASEENFLKDIDVFSELKFRASWGVTGNQAIAPYQTLAMLAAGADYNYPYSGGGTEVGFNLIRPDNPNLKWESTTKKNIGVDFGLFNGRLTATMDYYINDTDDLLLARTTPAYSGYQTMIDNVGSTQTKGWEVSLGGNPLAGAIKWETSFNISGFKTKVVDLGSPERLFFRTTSGAGYGIRDMMYLKEGEPFGQMLGVQTDGTWSTAETEEARKYGQLPGDIKYVDFNNSANDNRIDNKDLTVIGNALPDFMWGWNNKFSYKSFSLSFLVQAVHGNDIFNMGRVRLERPGEGTSTALQNRWTPENQDTDVPAFISQSDRIGIASRVKLDASSPQRLSRWVEDGSYIRLKSVTLAYNLPKLLINRIGLNNCRAYVSGANLITITDYTGYDPEVSSFNANDARMGIDFGNYPQARTFTLGLDLTF